MSVTKYMADHVNILRASTSPRVADHFSFKRSESMSLPLQCTSASRSDYREGSETQNPISQLPSHRQSRRMIKNTSDLNTVLTDSDIEETGICDFCNMSHAEEITVVQAHQTVLKRQGISLPDAIRRCYTFSLSFNNIHHPEKARHSHDEGCICVDGCGPLCPHAQDQVACGPLCHEGSPCGRQFPPCSCSGSCDQSKCSCIKFSRDCDGCSCENCTNSVSHNANSPAVVVKTSTIPEAEDGLFAAQYIAPGQHIGPFTGVFRFDGPDDDGPTRFFTFSKDSCIDSSVGGNYTYKINHAATKSAANVIFKHHYSMGTHVVKVVALRELWPGDEMLAQYCSNKSRKLTFVLASPVYNSNPPAVPDAFKIDKGKGDFNQRQVSTITWSSEYMVVPCGPWEACAPISLYIQGEKVEKGNYVSVKGETPKGKIEEWFAVVHDLRGSETRSFAHVIWMERPKAIPRYRRPPHGQSEVFLTLREGVIDVCSINSVISIRWVENIHEGLGHPYWRTVYDTDRNAILDPRLCRRCRLKTFRRPTSLQAMCDVCREEETSSAVEAQLLQSLMGAVEN